MNEKPIPTWWPLGLIAVGFFGMYSAYKALNSGEISGGRAAIWSNRRIYDRTTQPGKFRFMVIVTLLGASKLIFGGLLLLLSA